MKWNLNYTTAVYSVPDANKMVAIMNRYGIDKPKIIRKRGLDIWRDRCDQRLPRNLVSCVNFSEYNVFFFYFVYQKQGSWIMILDQNTINVWDERMDYLCCYSNAHCVIFVYLVSKMCTYLMNLLILCNVCASLSKISITYCMGLLLLLKLSS